MKRKPTERKRRNKADSNFSELKQILASLEEDRKLEREKFRRAMDELRGAKPIERAEGYLRFWANRLEQKEPT
jgi:hypothetical protein